MGTYSSSLFVYKSALMLSVEAARYIIRISPCTGAETAEGYYFLFKALYVFERLWLLDISDGFYLRRVSSYPLLGNEDFPSNVMVLGIPVISAWVHVKTSALALRRSRSLPLKCFGSYFLIATLLVSCPKSSWKWQYLDMSHDRLLPNIRGGCLKLLDAFSVARISLGLLYKLESSPWLGP
ncbi:hypothetical protein Tco_1305647 [Tanacetum coccineum]